MPEQKYKFYIINGFNGKTVNDFLKQKDGVTVNLTPYDFLMATNQIEGGGGLTNIQKIYDVFPQKEKDKYINTLNTIIKTSKSTVEGLEKIGGIENIISSIGEFPIYNGVQVIIPNEYYNSDVTTIKREGFIIPQTKIKGFISDKLKEIITDRLYVRDENLSLGGTNYDIEIVNQNIQVWIWCRAVNKIINISPFIDDLTTQKSDVGNFSLSLNPIKNSKDFLLAGGEDTVNYFPLRDKNGKSQMDYFHRNLQQNDIIFIRFERLKLDKNENKTYFEFEIDKLKLPGQVWDMIGLVDGCSSSTNFNSTDYSVEVSGRDLMKVLVEDAAVFLSRAYIESESDQFILTFDPNTKGFRRNFNGQFDPLQYEFLSGGRRIDESIGFIINQLSNLGVITAGNQNIFSAYNKSLRPSRYALTGTYGNDITSFTVEGIWQIIKLFVDEQLEHRRVVDMSAVSQESPIIDQFMKLCQDPFVEFYGDTYGDEFNLIVRQPPFTKEAILGFLGTDFVTKSSLNQVDKSKKESNVAKANIDNSGKSCIINIEAKDVMRYDFKWDETYYAWYQVEPSTEVLGKYNNMAVGNVLPILFFSKIAETFGNHRKVVVDNYLSAMLDESSKSDIDIENYRSQLLHDLKFIVDTNIYLPFTRKGSIVLTKGDRRIKKGTFIRFVPTGEICYVDGVTNNVRFSNTEVNRTTTIEVSRCMIEEYIKGSVGYEHDGTEIKGKTFSYFDIVNTELIINNLLKSEKMQVEQRSYDPQVSNIQSRELDGNEFSVKIPQSSRIAFEHNNPGNLEFNQFQIRSYKVEGDRWAHFYTPEDGFKQVIRQVLHDQKALDSNGKLYTVSSHSYKYMPPPENSIADIEQRVKNVVGMYTFSTLTVIGSDTLLNQLDSKEYAKILVRLESSTKVDWRKADFVENPIPNVTVPKIENPEYSIMANNKKVTEYNFGLDDEQFDFFQQRKQLNILDK